MSAKQFLTFFFLLPLTLYLILYACYLSHPKIFHFRAWEFFPIFVYNGERERHQRLEESGDSSREYFIQRYVQTNNITVNEYGNRIACFDPNRQAKPAVLLLGDSQLFGSGTDDSQTFPAHLCKQHHASIYNGANKHDMDLLRHPTMRFNSVLISKTERDNFSDSFCKQLDDLEAHYDEKLPESSFQIPGGTFDQTKIMLKHGHKFLMGYLRGRVKAFFYGINHGFIAPEAHPYKCRHERKDVAADIEKETACAKRITKFFHDKHMKVGFLYFPAHQTIYGKESNLTIDEGTNSFIDKMTQRLKQEGIPTFNSKQCLLNAKAKGLVYQMHDTHMNGFGYQALTECLKQSDLEKLFY